MLDSSSMAGKYVVHGNGALPGQQPVYAKIVKPVGMGRADTGTDGPINNVNGHTADQMGPSVTRSSSISGTGQHKKPTAPPRQTPDLDRIDARRHSWAGDKKGNI